MLRLHQLTEEFCVRSVNKTQPHGATSTPAAERLISAANSELRAPTCEQHRSRIVLVLVSVTVTVLVTERRSASREVELEVELPRGRPRGIFPLFVHECEAQLDDFQQVHVAAQQLVLVVSVAPEFPDGSGHHAWKLSVLKEETNTHQIN